MSTSLYCIASAPTGALDKLAKAGIATVHDLVSSGDAPSNRHDLADDTKVTRTDLYALIKQADLLRINGLPPEQADLLVKVGIRTVADLAAATPAKVHAACMALPASETGGNLEDIVRWQAIARTLKPLVTPEPGDPAPIGLGEPGQFTVTTTPVDARYASEYNYTAEGSSLLRTRLVPMPPNAFMQRMLDLKAQAMSQAYELELRKAELQVEMEKAKVAADIKAYEDSLKPAPSEPKAITAPTDRKPK